MQHEWRSGFSEFFFGWWYFTETLLIEYYILIQIKQCKLASMNEIHVAYGSRSLCGSGFLHLLFAALSFSSSLQRIEFFICSKTTLRYRIHHIEKLPSLQGTVGPGFPMRWSQSASSIGGVILRGRPPQLSGGLLLPNKRRLVQTFLIECSLQ